MITFADAKTALDVCDAYNGEWLCGSKIEVCLAAEKPPPAATKRRHYDGSITSRGGTTVHHEGLAQKKEGETVLQKFKQVQHGTTSLLGGRQATHLF